MTTPTPIPILYGIGVDVLRVARGRKLWERHGERATRKLLHPAEQRLLEAGREPGALLTRSFAVKEAFVKALGTGFAGIGIEFKEVGVERLPNGCPKLVFSTALKTRLDALGVGAAHVSLSDDGGLITAFVVLERKPPTMG